MKKPWSHPQHGKTIPEQILSNHALEQAAQSSDLDALKTAAQIQQSVAPPPTDKTHVALLVALGTIFFQILQLGWTTWVQARSGEDTQWKTAVQSVSLEDGPKALNGALNIETFYGSARYRDDALKLVAASLPVLTNADAFDQICVALRDNLPPGNENILYEINRSIVTRFDQDFVQLTARFPELKQGISANESSNNARMFDRVLPFEIETFGQAETASAPPGQGAASAQPGGSAAAAAAPGSRLAPIDDIKLREWEIDSLAGFTIQYWRTHGRDLQQPRRLWARLFAPSPPSAGEGQNLTNTSFRGDRNGVIDMTALDLAGFAFSNAYLGAANLAHSSLRNANLAQADLSHADLTATDLRGANLDQADLSHVTGAPFDKNLWQGVCNAGTARLSGELMAFLQSAGLLAAARSASCPKPLAGPQK